VEIRKELKVPVPELSAKGLAFWPKDGEKRRASFCEEVEVIFCVVTLFNRTLTRRTMPFPLLRSG
jgi:hypothetical protein